MTKFMVQWEDHPSHLATRLGALLEHQKLVDVTLMCNTHTLRVHRAVLAAGSPYFEGILMRNLGQHPLIVLKDMQFSVLKSLIEFMYCGETSVTEENLPALLQAAKFFQVRGLSAMTKEALGLPAESGTSVNGAPNPSVSIGTHKAFVRPQKRVNIQSVKTAKTLSPGASGTNEGRAVFHTVPKTIAAQATPESQAANAQLLLSLSEGKPKKALGTPTQPNMLKKAAGGAVTTPPKNRFQGRNVRSEPQAAPPPLGKPSHSNILGNKKRPRPMKPAPDKAPVATATSHESTLYQDPETNIIYQIEQPAAAVEDNVIYQLPDGTISDQHGNPLLDKDGNTQNILNYQLPEPQTTFEMSDGQFVLGGDSDADMPILLDNGDGNFVTVHEDSLKNIAATGFADGGVAYTTNDKGEYVVYKGADPDADKPVMSVEEALEEMMADDKEENPDNGITVEGVGVSGSDDVLLEAGSEFLAEDGFLADGSEQTENFESTSSQEQHFLEADASAYHEASESIGDTYLETEPTFSEAEPSFTEAESSYAEAEPSFAEAEPSFAEAEPSFAEAEPSFAEAEPSFAEAEPSFAEAEPSFTEAEPSFAEAEPSFAEAEPSFAEAEPSFAESEPTFAEAESMLEEGESTFEGVSSAGDAFDTTPVEGSAENGIDTTSSLLKNALTGGGPVATGTVATSQDEAKEGAEESSIPFAVGLLPLQDALQKFQDMPEHTPRKTRSSDEPAVRSKRKGSSGSENGTEPKRILLTEDWKISEDECETTTEANG